MKIILNMTEKPQKHSIIQLSWSKKPLLPIAIGMLCLFVVGFGYGQNLVENSSFEEYSQCPSANGELTGYVNKWFNPCPPDQSIIYGTPDYFNSCDQNDVVSVPSNFYSFLNANSGNAYIGLHPLSDVTFDFDGSEYISSRLLNSLSNGITYYVSFYIALADSSGYTTDDIGIYFSNDSISDHVYLLPYLPQLNNIEGEFITNNKIWKQLQFEFIANGGENFITIGNFKNYANTDTLYINPNVVLYKNLIYFYIDDVCVSTSQNECFKSNNIFDHQNENIVFYPNPVNDYLIFNQLNENFNYSLFDEKGIRVFDGKINEINNKIDFKTLSNGIYILKLMNENQILTYKITKNEN